MQRNNSFDFAPVVPPLRLPQGPTQDRYSKLAASGLSMLRSHLDLQALVNNSTQRYTSQRTFVGSLEDSRLFARGEARGSGPGPAQERALDSQHFIRLSLLNIQNFAHDLSECFVHLRLRHFKGEQSSDFQLSRKLQCFSLKGVLYFEDDPLVFEQTEFSISKAFRTADLGLVLLRVTLRNLYAEELAQAEVSLRDLLYAAKQRLRLANGKSFLNLALAKIPKEQLAQVRKTEYAVEALNQRNLVARREQQLARKWQLSAELEDDVHEYELVVDSKAPAANELVLSVRSLEKFPPNSKLYLDVEVLYQSQTLSRNSKFIRLQNYREKCWMRVRALKCGLRHFICSFQTRGSSDREGAGRNRMLRLSQHLGILPTSRLSLLVAAYFRTLAPSPSPPSTYPIDYWHCFIFLALTNCLFAALLTQTRSASLGSFRRRNSTSRTSTGSTWSSVSAFSSRTCAGSRTSRS